MGKEMVNQVQEAQRVPYRLNTRINTSRHILIILTEIKHRERILKHRGKATSSIQGITHRINGRSFSRESTGQKGMAEYI